MKAFYSDHFVLPLPAGHRFPMEKYAWLRQRVAQRWPAIQLLEPRAADDATLALAHTPAYIEAVSTGTLPPAVQKAIGFPWSWPMVERSRRSVGATVDALLAALESGAAVNLAGGTHHAHADRGAGFCVFNDVAVAARVAQAHRAAKDPVTAQADHAAQVTGRVASRPLQVLVIDLDVHQGDGTASILQNDPTVFTFSMHGRDNYPFERAVSDLDIELDSQTGDTAYLMALQGGLATVSQRFVPDAVIYVAGVDVHANDRLGRLAVSADGIAARDQVVLDWCRVRGLPVAMCMAGGYGRDLSAMVDIQVAVVGRLFEYQRQWQLARPSPVFE